MKPVLIIIMAIISAIVTSCGVNNNTKNAVKWVNSHPKPIVVTSVSYNGWNCNYRCMFKDSAGIVFYAGEVAGFKPDTIK